MEKHTPGPWAVDMKNYGGRYIGDGRRLIATTEYNGSVTEPTGITVAEAEANARRIVACVNHCEGIDTETLQAMDCAGRAPAPSCDHVQIPSPIPVRTDGSARCRAVYSASGRCTKR